MADDNAIATALGTRIVFGVQPRERNPNIKLKSKSATPPRGKKANAATSAW